MARTLRLFLFVVLTSPAEAARPRAAVEVVARGFERPVGVKFDPDGIAHIVEQGGRVIVVHPSPLVPLPQAGEGKGRGVFLDVSDRVTRLFGYSEQGLLDVAFHPEYRRNGRVFVHYTDRRGDTVLSEFKASGGVCDPASERVLLTWDQPHSNHNGGQIEFGPDGYLYFSLGDGGGAGDPHGNGQKLDTVLGKILRLDVSSHPYTVPSSNPFASKGIPSPHPLSRLRERDKGRGETRPEIWAFGLRNVWKFSFDGTLLYLADVGQHRWEEIDVEETAAGGGRDYGWNVLEGEECFRAQSCDRGGRTPPVLVYGHDEGDCSVTGGYVYRGKAIPDLQGAYFYADYCTGRLASFHYRDGKAVERTGWNELNPGGGLWGQISAFGRDNEGELYIVSYDRGTLLKIVPAAPLSPPSPR